MAIGDFHLIEDEGSIIIAGPPLIESSRSFEMANWIGIITTPSATLAIEQLNSFSKSINSSNFHTMGRMADDLLRKFFRYVKTVDIASTYFMRYKVPFKNHVGIDAYALVWPYTNGEDLNLIRNKLNEFLNFQKFQTEIISHDIYEKYLNTKIFSDFVEKEKFEIMQIEKDLQSMGLLG
jgi:hypothetical protein